MFAAVLNILALKKAFLLGSSHVSLLWKYRRTGIFRGTENSLDKFLCDLNFMILTS